jgi:Fe-S cluster assembly protein SufD
MTSAPVIIKRTVRSSAINEFAFTERNIPVSGFSMLNESRQKAWKNYQALSFPGDKDEAWRRTALTGMDRNSYRMETPLGEFSDMPEALKQPLAGDQQDGQVITQPGKSIETLSNEYKNCGVIFNSFCRAIELKPDLLEKFGTIVKPEEDKFAALTSALADDGVILYVPKGVKIANPLHSIFWGGGEKSAIFSRLFIWLEEGAEVTYVHEYASSHDVKQDMLHCGLVEVHAGPESHLKFVELQSWGRGVWNITHERAVIQHDAQVEWIFGAVGSRLTKTFTDFDLADAGATIKASGFFFADGKQHFDHDTQQNHLAPNTTSDLLYKGAVTDESHSVWQGMIYVAPGAEKTDGYQANRNLILCKNARADSIPGLEILADDVRCSHGATVGKIDEEQIYYLQTRGLTTSESKRLIVEGFFEPVMDRIPFEGVKNRFRESIQRKMNTICE